MVYIFFPFKDPQTGKYYIFDTHRVLGHRAVEYDVVIKFICKRYKISENKYSEYTAWCRTPNGDGSWRTIIPRGLLLLTEDFVFVGSRHCEKVKDFVFNIFVEHKKKKKGARGPIVITNFRGLDMIEGTL